jgi:hypothetical protein
MKYEFRWNTWNVEHIESHGVSRWDAEYVVSHPGRGFPRNIEDDKVLVEGQTIDGIHARPLNEREKRNLRKRRKR